MKKVFVKGFEDVEDPVKTEQQIFNQLSSLHPEVKEDYSHVVMPIADLINKIGLQNTQNIINDVCDGHPNERLIFICQHIQVCNLNFHNNIVFTPHATIFDSYIPIPHYSCNYDIDYSKPWEEREYDFSFMGDFGTHTTRGKIHQFLRDRPNTAFIDTKNWHFYSDKKTQTINKKNYIELLGNTKYSLCPRGTGPSTIRIWESMAMNSCPIIFSDYLKMPLEMHISNNLWFKIPEKCDSININLNKYNNDQYWDLFSNDYLYKSIINVI